VILEFVEINWVEYRFDETEANKGEERCWPKQLSTQCLGIEPGVEGAGNPSKPTHTDFAEARCAESAEPSCAIKQMCVVNDQKKTRNCNYYPDQHKKKTEKSRLSFPLQRDTNPE